MTRTTQSHDAWFVAAIARFDAANAEDPSFDIVDGARRPKALGYDDATVARVRALIRKERLKSDAEAQALEDVVALVFLESYLADFVAAHGEYDEAKLIDIVHKTGRKMSARGRASALTEISTPA